MGRRFSNLAQRKKYFSESFVKCVLKAHHRKLWSDTCSQEKSKALEVLLPPLLSRRLFL